MKKKKRIFGKNLIRLMRKSVKKTDDRGATLVVVIVALALLGILSSIVLYTTYINYTIKLAEAKANDNFYTGEMAMEEIKAGLEQEVSNAFSGAYLSVMQDYNSYDEVERVAQFQYLYLSRLEEALKDPLDPTKYNWDKLVNYISDPSKVTLAEAAVQSLVKYSDSIQLKGLQLTYTNEQGYVAIISTDVVLKIPNVQFDTASTLPDMLTYSLIADDSLVASNVGTSQILGNAYAGKNGILVANGVDLYFMNAETVATAGNVLVTGSGSSFHMASDSSLWADGIVVNSGELALEGNAYIQDDLTIQGSGSVITLSGGYYGYGYQSVSDGSIGPDNCSSILINGSGTVLDMSGLSKLALAGQAYIGTKDRDLNEDGTISPDEMFYYNAAEGEPSSADNEDVRMGQSIAVKSDQLAYLVPAECIGIIDGESVLGTNPVNISDYQEFLQRAADEAAKKSAGLPYSVVTEVDLSRIAANLPRKLSDYGASFQRVFYQAAGSSNAWVYYYLEFDSPQFANLFFQDYYAYNTELLTDYMSNYLVSFTAPESFGRLNLAGNAVFCDADGNYALTESTMTSDAITEYTLLMEYDSYENIYQALQVNLSRNYALLTDEQKAQSVFYNIINVDQLRDCVAESGSTVRTFPEGASESDAEVILIDNAGGGVYTVPDSTKLKLVIATGDVNVGTNYSGLIISGGKISIMNGAVITADPNGVSVVMLKYDEVLECFAGSEALGAEGDSEDSEDPEDTEEPAEEVDEVITTESLVSYMNWSKQ